MKIQKYQQGKAFPEQWQVKLLTEEGQPYSKEEVAQIRRTRAKDKTKKEHEQIVAYNKEHGTNFSNIEQVQKHAAANARAFTGPVMTTDEFGNLHQMRQAQADAAAKHGDEKAQWTYVGKPALQDAGKMAGATATVASVPFIGVGATAAGLVGGTAGGYAGSKLGGYIDEKAGTKWVAPTLGLVGGFVGGGLGMRGFSNFRDIVFTKTPGSFTRGIGQETGLADLLETGVVRGNPKGTGMTPKTFNKVKYRGRDSDFWGPLLKEHKNILNNFYNQNLTETEWNALRKAYDSYSNSTFPNTKPIVMENKTYADYLKNGEGHFQLTWDKWHSETQGNPPAYFYNDGRNPFGEKSYNYAKSKFAVKVKNADSYGRYIPEGHVHESLQQPVLLSDPNVELFKRGPFNIGIKLDKNTGVPMWKQKWGSPIPEWNYHIRTRRNPFISSEQYVKSITPEIQSVITDGNGRLKTTNLGGAESPNVYLDKTSGKVIKVSAPVTNEGVGLKQVNHMLDKQNIGTLGVPTFYEGLVQIQGVPRIVTSQYMVKPWHNYGDFALPFIKRNLAKAGYKYDGSGIYITPNGRRIRDIKAANVGKWNGNFVIFDPEIISPPMYKKGGKLKRK